MTAPFKALSAAEILKACEVCVPINASIDAAIEAHRMACGGELADPALRAVLLARVGTREEGQRQFDYLLTLPDNAWRPPLHKEATMTSIARVIATFQLN